METLPDFVKLYGEIKGTLKQGVTYEIRIKSIYNAASIDTKKYIIFAEVGNFGSRNDILAWILIGSSAFSSIVIIVFLIMYVSRLHGRVTDSDDYIF